MANCIRRRDVITLAAGAATSLLARPLAALGQQGPLPVIGYLGVGSASVSPTFSAAFREGLREQGYVDGRNVEILYRWVEPLFDRWSAPAADLVRRHVAVIAATGDDASVLAAQKATSTIPIVFAIGGDPVGGGLVASLNHPGGNVTGATFLTTELVTRRLELLHEIVPAVTSVGFFVNPTSPSTAAQIREAQTAARILGVRLVILNASTPSEIEAAFAALVGQRIGAFFYAGDPLFGVQRDQLVTLAARHGVPSIHNEREAVDAGALMTYGASLSDAWRVAGTYAGRILKGQRPADLPVQQSTRIEMALNLKTAKALGIEVPLATLLRADKVIE